MSTSLRIPTSSQGLRWPREQVGRRCQTSGGAVKDQVELCKASAGADPESICRSRTVLVVRASPKTPRFLPVRGRHDSALFRAFVRVEGDPPRPRRRERPAGGSPTVFGPRHRKRVPWLAKDPRPRARERAEAEPNHERNGTRRDRTRAPQRMRARRRRKIAGEPRREWRGSPGVAQRSRQGNVEPAAGTRVTRARPNS
jgi:hypothetical protein